MYVYSIDHHFKKNNLTSKRLEKAHWRNDRFHNAYTEKKSYLMTELNLVGNRKTVCFSTQYQPKVEQLIADVSDF